MYGAIIGDIVGSRFEGHRHNIKTKEFDLFHEDCRFTDDTVLSLAVCKASMESKSDFSDLGQQAETFLRMFGENYPHRGYGSGFLAWLDRKPGARCDSYGNGSAMRVSGCAYVGRTLDEVKMLSRKVTEVTHNSKEGIRGAEAVAVATFLARTGKSIPEIRDHICREYYPEDQYPDMARTLDEIRPTYASDSSDCSCEGTVPYALLAFFESTDFEDTIRNAVSLGGDSDTIAAMAGSVAEAYFGVPDKLRAKAEKFLNVHMLMLVDRFEERYPIHP